MRVHGDVVAAEQRATQVTVVATAISLVDGNDDQSTFGGFDEFRRAVLDLVASLFFRVVIPSDRLVLQNVWYLDEATEMNTLTIGDDDFLPEDAGVANVLCLV